MAVHMLIEDYALAINNFQDLWVKIQEMSLIKSMEKNLQKYIWENKL